ncbi:MAG: phosphohydrolase, partial [Clostridia bacterium]|nr:phosphohydrolase [Clostridia bacterium]
FLVGHHHTLTDIDGIDWQILLEADYLVNADEGKQTKEKIEARMANMFKTASGTALLKSMYSKILED